MINDINMGLEGLSFSAPEENLDSRYDKYKYGNSEEGERLLARDVAFCSDFRELFNVIDLFGDWRYSDGAPLDKTLLKELINDVRAGRRTVEYITSRYGLRTKVTELLSENYKKTSGNIGIVQELPNESDYILDVPGQEAEPSVGTEEEVSEPTSPEGQDQEKLAQAYVVAYKAYKSIADNRINDLRILDKLREEGLDFEAIGKQEEKFAASRDAENIAMNKYVEIWDKLTPETQKRFRNV